jgi:serine/threonine protein phosphatase 1
MRRLIVGDIQGCHTELLELLDRAGLGEEDEVVAVGDIVDRGPDSPAVVDFFRSAPRARSAMGNHERKHLRWQQGRVAPALSQQITRRQFGEQRYLEALSFFAGLPRWVELPEAVVVHAFWEPGRTLEEQREEVLVGTMSGEAYLERTYRRPWWELYDGPKPIVVGHHHYLGEGRPLVHRDRVYAIDTGCCFGFALTGLLLPEFRLLSVRARANHWSRQRTLHAPQG